MLVNIREKCNMNRQSAHDDENWTHFQHSLRIIQACGKLIVHSESSKYTISIYSESYRHVIRSLFTHCRVYDKYSFRIIQACVSSTFIQNYSSMW